MWSSAERPERKVTVEVATLEGSEEGGSPETAETSVAAFEELRHRGRKRKVLAEEKGGGLWREQISGPCMPRRVPRQGP